MTYMSITGRFLWLFLWISWIDLSFIKLLVSAFLKEKVFKGYSLLSGPGESSTAIHSETWRICKKFSIYIKQVLFNCKIKTYSFILFCFLTFYKRCTTKDFLNSEENFL
jgi:hypothetical protein